MQPTAATPIPLDDPSLYLNRELSWLQFNRRVLEEAQDRQVPLLERLKFLAIFSSNLDEFFMVRVGGLQQKVHSGITRGSGPDRMPPQEQLVRIADTVRDLVAAQYDCLAEVLPALADKGIIIRGLKDLTPDDRVHLADLFWKDVFPVVTPHTIDPGHPFPHLLNKSLTLAVQHRESAAHEVRFGVVKVPSVLPRFVQLPADRPDPGAAPVLEFVPLEDVIHLHLSDLFPGMEFVQVVEFRVSRDTEFELDEDVEDLLEAIEERVKKRRFGEAVRLEIEASASADLELFLTTALELDPIDVTRVPGMLDLTGLFQLHALPEFADLRDPHCAPAAVRDFAQATNIWAAIRAKDILVHHPYESFGHVVDFLAAAADDPRVLVLKQTLYRTSSDSPIIKALERAADNGKEVTAVIELKARLDEERNILWAKALEKVGVQVVYGFVGLKIHCKIALVLRRDEDGVTRRYVHLATGNYNPQTARTYTDLGLFTCRPAFAEDATLLFNHLTACTTLPPLKKLIVAPTRLLPALIEKIDREAANQKAGRKARIVAKLNGILEPKVVQALYRASQAGVRIDLVCRGVCALRPGLPGVSETIRVVSIVDRFLEHSRLFYFENGGDPEVLVGSADWMDRNLIRRVEVVFPVEQPDLKARLVDEILGLSLADNTKARELQPDGSYRRVVPADGQPAVRSQQRFLALASEAERRPTAPLPAEPARPPGANGTAEPKAAKRGRAKREA